MSAADLDVRTFTVGAFRENCYIVRRRDGDEALLIDPGDEAERLIEAVDAVGARITATLITHTHIDHIGAVAALARHTGAPVYCPALEREILADIDGWMGPLGFTAGYESYDADELLAGGEHVELAGLSIDVLFTPGHSVGHLTFALPEHDTLLVGDVLFRGSVGRVDIPGGDWPTLMSSIARLLEGHPDETHVLPGHGPRTTLGAERATNPFLTELAAR
ncbi:MAG TPA: MBL fold metallo-hydrolase [Solirubrobacteraceae bacterium]|jgi:glyoxylase-like metal-dependent hydrolase (beta-lactamase superfamily II)|nr:MBL fold metallo-hydrolase [Solirubrobacteraceae bacterium]